MNGQYDFLLVTLSVLIAVAASYTALSLSVRLSQCDGRTAAVWYAGGSVAMGIGIWSMHFIGMLAFSLPIPIVYDASTTAASLLIAILACAMGLRLVAGPKAGPRRALVSAGLMTLGISLMHFTGMEAIQIEPAIRYDPLLVAASVAVAFVASLAALRMLLSPRHLRGGSGWLARAGAAGLMGAGVSGMHFTGMAAAHFAAGSVCIADAGSADPFSLALAIGLGTLALLAATAMVATFQAHLTSRTALLNASLRAANDELAHLATHDSLTGLPNRALLVDRIEKSIEAAQGRRVLALLFVDLDRFKFVNDSAGHHVGDKLLQSVADRVRTCLGRTDTLARLGGDEFVVLLSDLDSAEAAADVAAAIMAALKPSFHLQGHDVHMSATLGISVYPDDGDSVESLLKNADTAMYHAKQGGRGTVRFFAPAMDAYGRERLAVETGLRRALAEGQLVLHYQPKVDIRSGEVVSLEALVRWAHPIRGLVGPDAFIHIAEDSGLIGPIGEWVLQTACAQARAWQDAGLKPLPVAVNISARQFRQTRLLEFVRNVLRDSGLHARYLELELTESTVMAHAEESVMILRSLSQMGVQLAIDDFGTGYSNLANLKRLPLNTLKVDRSFVTDIATSEDGLSIVRAIISMAHSLRLTVIAEGVETGEQLELLKALGCHQFQGYYFSKPVDASAARRFMQRLPGGARVPPGQLVPTGFTA